MHWNIFDTAEKLCNVNNLLKFISQTKIRKVKLWWTMAIAYRQCANNTLSPFPYIQPLPGTMWNVLVREAMIKIYNLRVTKILPTKLSHQFQKALNNNRKKTSFLSVSCSVLSPHLALMLEHAAGVTANSRMPLSYILLALLTSI